MKAESIQLKIHLAFLMILLICVPILQWVTGYTHKEYFLVVVGLWGILNSILTFKKTFTAKLNIIDLCVIAFIIYELSQWLFFSKASIYSIQAWQRIGFSLFYFLLRSISKTHKNNFNKLIVIAIVCKVIFELVIAVFQSFNFLNNPHSKYFDVIGSFPNPNYLAYTFVVGLLVFGSILFKKYKSLSSLYKNSLYVILGCLAYFVIYITCRSAYLGLTFALLISILRSNMIKKLSLKSNQKIVLSVLGLLVIVLSAIGLYHLKKDSADGRALITKITTSEILKHPILGHGSFSFAKGYNESKAAYLKKNNFPKDELLIADYANAALNDYLQITYETGLIGLFFMLGIIAFVVFKSGYSFYENLGLGLFVSLCIAGLFSSIHRNEIIVLLLIMSAVIASSKLKTYSLPQAEYFLISTTILVALGLFSMGSVKMYCKNQLFNVFKNKESIKNISYSDWKKYSKICSNYGLSEFSCGKYAYRFYNKKEEGLDMMLNALTKNIDPKNVKLLGHLYLKENDYKNAEFYYKLHEGIEPYRYEPKMNLIKLYVKTNNKISLCLKAQEIIDFPVKIPSEKVDKYKTLCQAILKKKDCIKN